MMKKVIATTLMTLGLFAAGAHASYTLEETQMFAGSDNFHAQVENHQALQSDDNQGVASTSLFSAEEVRQFATASNFHQRVAENRADEDESESLYAGAFTSEETRLCATASDVNQCVAKIHS
ncbi:hypothetical protein [Thaumasiovibrio subtropicus]|uniref:hypothetical protein n=1 Tax=Thaumasiovibrio subtropicus TaxID=1891207 RepID=UPI000B359AF0|nr:hypothetical protein [Thaumasiovibrio subtropicus]